MFGNDLQKKKCRKDDFDIYSEIDVLVSEPCSDSFYLSASEEGLDYDGVTDFSRKSVTRFSFNFRFSLFIIFWEPMYHRWSW